MENKLTAMENHLLRRANVSDFIKRSAQIYPHDVILVDANREVDFAELNVMVNRASNALLKAGIKRGDRVSVISHSCIDFIVLWYGVMKIGGVINPINVALKGDEIEYIVNHAEPTILVVEDALTPNVDAVREKLKSVKQFYFFNLTETKTGKGWKDIKELIHEDVGTDEPFVEAGDYDPATLIYTSGTESRPKGVLGSHIGLHFSTMHAISDLDIGKNNTLLLVAPLYHIAGLLLCTASIYIGAKIVVDTFPDPTNIMGFTKNQKVTIWTFPPALLALMPHIPGFSKDDIQTVTKIIAFGASLPKPTAEVWKGILPLVTMFNYYGQTESGPLGTLSSGDDIIAHPGSIGKPHRLVEIKIFNDEDKPVPTGEVGEIVIRGPSVMIGYLKDEEKTAQAFRNGWLHTADLARIDEDGFFHFVDRKKDIIVTGSENVSSLEIEQFLLSHPKVADAAVIGVSDPRWGEAVTAVIVPKPNETINEEEIITYSKGKIAGFKVPKKVFITDALPRSTTGKVLKTILREKFSAQ